MEVTHIQVEAGGVFDVAGGDVPVQLGVMTDVVYQVVGGDDQVTVSTTRPETMLGDTGVAVHPHDPRSVISDQALAKILLLSGSPSITELGCGIPSDSVPYQ